MTTVVVTHDTGGRAQPVGATYVLPDRALVDAGAQTALAAEPVDEAFTADLLSACLAHERCGVHLYRSVAGRTTDRESGARYEHFGAETARARPDPRGARRRGRRRPPVREPVGPCHREGGGRAAGVDVPARRIGRSRRPPSWRCSRRSCWPRPRTTGTGSCSPSSPRHGRGWGPHAARGRRRRRARPGGGALRLGARHPRRRCSSPRRDRPPTRPTIEARRALATLDAANELTPPPRSSTSPGGRR